MSIDGWQEVLEVLGRNKLRASLTALSVAWGIFMLVLLLAAGNGLRHGVEWDFRDDVTNSIGIRQGKTSLPHAGHAPGRPINFDNPDLWKQVDAQVHYRFAGQQAFSTRYVDFFRRVGNDARYEVRLRNLDPFHAMPSVVPADQCPAAALELSEDGFYVKTTVELYFTADAVDIRPESGDTFVGRFEDYAAPYAACL